MLLSYVGKRDAKNRDIITLVVQDFNPESKRLYLPLRQCQE